MDESSAEDSWPVDDTPAVDQSSAEDSPPADARPPEAPIDQATPRARRADAFMDMVNVALAAADHGHAAGDDRYLVHVVTSDGGRSFTYLDQAPFHPADAAMISCDSAATSPTVSATAANRSTWAAKPGTGTPPSGGP